MASPVFTRHSNFRSPEKKGGTGFAATDGSVMTIENTMQKIVITFSVLLVSAAVGWFLPMVMLPALAIAFVLGLVNSFKKEPSPALILAYAFTEGLTIGALSGIMERVQSGIVSQAIIGTLCVVSVVLLLFKSGKVRATPRMTKVFLIATLGYLLFSVVNLMLQVTGVVTDPWGLHSSIMLPHTNIPLGVALGVFAIILASYSLVMDFTFIDEGAKNRLPERYGWTAAFAITVTVVWLYVELIRLISILRR